MRIRPTRIVLPVLLALAVAPALAEDEAPEKSWTNKTELAYVMTRGNSQSSTFGFKNDFGRVWNKNTLTVKAGAVRVESTTFTRTAVDTGTDVVIVSDEDNQVTAENYFLNGRYERKISERFFWYVGAGWERNRFSGIDGRYLGEAGAGNQWVDSETLKWKTYYAATYTDENYVVADPTTGELSSSFAGAKVGSDLFWRFTQNAEYQNVTDFYYNFDESDAWRGDMVNSLSVAINKVLALKASLAWKYENRPRYEEVEIVSGPTAGQFAPFQLDKLDTIFTTSLVINF